MTKKAYTEADMAAVSDNPEWTAETTARSKSFEETFPDTAAKIRRTRGPGKAPTKEARRPAKQ